MKTEKIYEIPVNDAFGEDCECALCFLERNLETKYLDFCLGPAMMKPEFRIETNKKGFCRRHLSKMLQYQNKLPLALVLDTHLNSACEILSKVKGFRKTADVDYILSELETLEKSCTVCDYMNDVFSKYLNVTLYMWSTDAEFAEKIEKSKGFCITHFAQLLKSGEKELSKKQFSEFADMLVRVERRELKRVNEDIDWFTKKFDYKNKDADWNNSKDAPQRTVSKLRKYADI